jgi:hypothetical protein
MTSIQELNELAAVIFQYGPLEREVAASSYVGQKVLAAASEMSDVKWPDDAPHMRFITPYGSFLVERAR